MKMSRFRAVVRVVGWINISLGCLTLIAGLISIASSLSGQWYPQGYWFGVSARFGQIAASIGTGIVLVVAARDLPRFRSAIRRAIRRNTGGAQ
jgi:hypothetical protein